MSDNIVKYFRTFHLPWSESVADDDIIRTSPFTSNDNVVVTLKLDGENCLAGETLVETIDGIKSIKWICENKYSGKVKCYDIINKCVSWDYITDWFITDNDECFYEILLEDGTTIELTANHLVWCTNSNTYKKVKHLSPEDDVLLSK